MKIQLKGTLCQSLGHDFQKVKNECAVYYQCTRCGKAKFIK